MWRNIVPSSARAKERLTILFGSVAQFTFKEAKHAKVVYVEVFIF
jgi:predicted nucleotidyltransferase